ncbi:FBN1-like protein [Mya arenaria]|uniref:FBN1-like protein n=1 Tax=Mya arenaria TaxID=6604 RepID=A0ABY7E9Z4_MYAAR|nr:FBN1-like protein [Mya arenaria]
MVTQRSSVLHLCPPQHLQLGTLQHLQLGTPHRQHLGPPHRLQVGPLQRLHLGPPERLQLGPLKRLQMGPPQRPHLGPPKRRQLGPQLGPPQHLLMGPPQRLHLGPPKRLQLNPPQRLQLGPPKRLHLGPPKRLQLGQPKRLQLGPPQRLLFRPPHRLQLGPPQRLQHHQLQLEQIAICPNGLMCFGRKYEGYTIPQRNRVVNSEFTGSFCLAPYFTDLNPNSAGDVFYQVYDSLSSDVNQTVYAKVKALVEAQYATTNFLPQYIVKATWDQIPRFGGPTAETVTFQAIYTTDGTHAYALYSYQPGGMKFENGDQFIGYINNGYAFGEFDTSTNGSFLRRPDKNLELGASGCIGGATYDVSVDEAALQNSRLKCLAWHKKESGNRQYYINQLNRMPLCPCFIEFMWWDPRFSVWDYEWQNGYEVISIPLFPSRRGGIYPNGKNCVYNWRTWSFIGSGKSAGTFTKYSPLVDRRLNALEDRQYKRVCCDEADLCEKYWDSRTDRAVKADGNASEATVFSGFAIQGDEVWAQAELNATKTGILLFVGNNKSSWSDFTDTYNNETAEMGISMNADLKNKDAVGLLGNYNDDPDDDLVPREGNEPITDTSERMTTEAESIFKYDEGITHNDFSHPEFTPQFLEEANQTMVQEANTTCNGNIQCIFDFVFTGDRQLALQTGSTEELADEAIADAINGEDDGTITYEFADNTDNVATFSDPASGNGKEIKFTLSSLDVVKVSVFVRDDKNVTSSEIEVTIIYCNGCTGNGNDCETDFDGCATDPCAIGQNCSDVSATGHTENGPAYNCSECPDGYTVVGTKCEDIDECNTTTPCDSNSVCTNTPGSYYCTCNMGFRLSTSNRTVCLATPPDACNAINCSGAVGCTTDADNDARCFCNAGYSLIAGNNTCTDTNECDNGPCSQTCSNSEGSFSCSCLTGYKLGTDRVSCTQCPYPTFGENCASTCQCGRGANRCDSVRGCICNSGWQGVNCDGDINECNTPNVCNDANKECANTIGSYTCSCRNVNECESDQLNTCEQTCTNSPGSFVCSCNTGYNVDPGNALRCVDYDECDAGVSGCQQKCLNSVGRFSCECYFGYRLNDDRKTCYQVQDVCAAEFPDFGCSHICKVENQQAFCLCETGYELSTDNKTCIDINECLTSGSCSDTATCTNKDGGYDCACPRGKKLANDKRTCTVCDSNHYGDNCALECNCGVGSSRCDSQTGCVCKSDGWIGAKCDQDTDECAIGTHNCTGTNEQCRNTPGSFVCECLPGYQRNAENICEDIEECIIPSLNTCSQQCENVPGSFTCSCHDGFTESGNSCNDVNECSTSTHGCGQTCENTIGSYRCTCNDGYRLDLTDFKTCIPSNVCSNSSYCSDNADCANNDGTDTCTCHTGFKFVSGSVTICEECPQGEYGPNCTESCACTEANTDRCDPIDGTCNCKPGYNLTDCSNDINECKDGSAVCPTNSECSNIPGSYVCNCKSGYLKTATGQCQECSNGKFGENCAQTCACNMTNTDSCDKVTGNCQCKPVWNGTTCNEDVDECNMGGPGPCAVKKNTTCNNTYGSYECNCVSGYQEDATGCVVVTCNVSNVPNAIANQSVVDVNNSVTYECNTTYVHTAGDLTRWCLANGTLNGTEPVCSEQTSTDSPTSSTTKSPIVVTCNVSNVPNAIANQSVVDINKSVTYECNTTYVHTAGDLTRWCLANGTLNGTEPVCSVVTCNVSNVPNAIANQSVVDINNSITYECNTTYIHTGGDLTRWCLANGTLNGTEPRCSVVTCNVSSVPNAIANQSVVDINNSVTYECNTTYYHKAGDLTRWCLTNGTLNGTEPVCSEQTSTDSPTSSTTKSPIACSGNTYGDSCNNMCDCATDHAETSEQTCNHTTGACMCRAQWGGSRCEIDVDECADPLLNNCTAQNKYCHNIIGGYNCSCLRNYQENTATTTTLAPEEDGIEVFIVFQIPATTLQNVNFSIASTFQKWADDVGQTLLKYYMATMGNRVKRVNVFHIEIGSLKVNATIIKEDSEEAAQLLSQATSELDNVMLEVNGENYTATASALAGVQIDHNADSAKLLCDLYILDRGSCGDKQVCVVINTKPVCQPMKDDDNLDLVLGLGIGFPLFFLLAIVIFLVIKLTLKRRQQKRRFYTEEGMGISGFPNNGFFPTAMPTKINTWGRNDSAYRPQEWEEESSTSSGSSDDVRRKRKYKDRDNYGETQVHDHQPSMFSWDFMYNYINPNEPYRIQRPQYRPQP